ncbi:30S ribosomal subunit protein S4 (S9e) [Candidatus Karelsulcia muelleri]|nr:30S ribosomal subunit protein S4 (S9e) [Candidatus Karelsulcia muelleri]
MARYIGPKTKISRKFGELIYGKGKTNKSFEKKKYPPGQHANSSRKKTFYSTQLLEKQKSKYTYGILERQFRKMFYKASKKKGIKGEILLQLCESRLDNIVYRLNLSHSRPEARQLVSHRHITVNGKIVNIPSFNLKPGDKISLKQIGSLKQKKLGSDWLSWDNEKMIGIFKYLPKRKQIPEKINEKLIVELYSK